MLPIANGPGGGCVPIQLGEFLFDSTPEPQPFGSRRGVAFESPIRDTMTSNIESLEALSQDYQSNDRLCLRSAGIDAW